MNSHFYAMLFRMKYIDRWALMRNTKTENLSEHSLETAFIAHALAIIENKRFGGKVDAEKAAVLALKAQQLTVATAEGLTGGGVVRRLTEVAGASSTVRGGICTYTDEMKRDLLGVLPETLKRHGAVSAETALEMARGIREKTGADIGVSTTGVAGPDPSEGKAVGTVFVAVSCGWMEQVWPLQLARGTGNERERVRHLSENHALHGILQAVRAKKEEQYAENL